MRRILLLAIVLIAISIPGGVLAQPAIRSEIAPTGKVACCNEWRDPSQLVTANT